MPVHSSRATPPVDRQPCERFVFPQTAAAAKFRDFFDYWVSKAPPDRLPGRQHIDPVEMRAFLPNVMMFDVVHDVSRIRFRIRLFGTGLYPLWQTDLTGKWMEDFVPVDQQDDVHAGLMHVVITRQAQYGTRRLVYPGRDLAAHERLMVPLAADGETVDILMGLYFPVARPT